VTSRHLSFSLSAICSSARRRRSPAGSREVRPTAAPPNHEQSIGTLRCMKNETLKEAMEEPHSVSSPRRILSLSKKKRASVSFSDPDDKASGFGLSGEHGPKPSEVYGFVGSITTVVATVIFFTWAYVPEHWLHAVGIYYYPSRYWALAVPTYIVVTVALALAFYIGLNFLSTPPPTSLNTLFDEFTRDPSIFGPLGEGDELPIEPLSDIPIDEINRLMFDDVN
ncbi:hypothetical protein ACJRO7_020459, partial [Eucalyptus globulus]